MRSTLKLLGLLAIAVVPALATGCGGVTNDNIETHVITEDELEEARKMMQAMPTPADAEPEDSSKPPK